MFELHEWGWIGGGKHKKHFKPEHIWAQGQSPSVQLAEILEVQFILLIYCHLSSITTAV
jgi:hypothetical protein